MANKKTFKKRTNADVMKKITDKVIEALKAGRIAWQRPWVGGQLPMNYVSKRTYNGINLWMTFFAPYTSPYWVTYKQAQQLGGNIKKGEKGTIVTFWKILSKPVLDEKGAPVLNKLGNPAMKKIFLLKEYTIFNAEQCEGIDFKEVEMPAGADTVTDAEELLKLYADAPKVVNRENRAYYSPVFDIVNMPKREMFTSTDGYYSTLFHEMAHSTGHASRLNREGVANFDKFGSHQYSVEELVAEMSACLMMANAGLSIEPNDNSKAYIQGWISKLENDPKFIFKASKEAQKACDYMMGLIEEKGEENEGNEATTELKSEAA